MRVAREIREAGETSGVGTLRLGLLTSFSLQFVDPFLVVEGLRRGLRLETYFGGFGQFEQELMVDGSGLAEFESEALVIVMRPEDLDPDAVIRYHAPDGDNFDALIEGVCTRVSNCIRRFRERSTAPVLVANFAEPPSLPLGIFDANVADSLTYALGRANQQLREVVDSFADAVIWDYAGLVRSRGTGNWTDPRLWALARMAVGPEHQPQLAQHLLRTLCAVLQRPAKCLVVDLDNTLWGGVVGDDGLEGIQLGDDYPGNVFKSFQRSVLGLIDRGFLLAVVSKNECEVAKRVFEEHPEMLIRWSDAAAARINWEPKSANIRSIAQELNIGSDAMVLFDDNPVERAEVQANAPEVNVIDVPPNPCHRRPPQSL
jgi:HAD superfamily phosphatase (TIGR01681 family)